MGETVTKVRETSDVLLGLVAMAIIGILALIILGNLQGNTGFGAGTTGENNTNALIDNFTTGQVVFFGFSNVWFTLLAVTLLIVIIAGAVVLFKPGAKGGFN